MGFWETVTAILIGTIAGFVFSIVLFYLTEHIKSAKEKANTLEGLRRELRYDLGLLDTFHSTLGKVTQQVAAGDHNVFHYLSYARFSRLFIQQSFGSGLLFEQLDNDDIVELDKILRFFDTPSEQWVNAEITRWKNNLAPAPDVLMVFNFHRDSIEKHKKILERIRKHL